MNQHFPEKMTGKPRISGRPARVLVAPLDWGLGHATRCIPIINELLAMGADVWLAGEKAQKRLLKEEFPELPFLQLQGYRIRYAGTASRFAWQLLRQLPKMKNAINAEHEWLRKMVIDYKFDAVISDNRYGLYHPGIPSVIITHQLCIKTGWGKWTERILQQKNYRFINRFTNCWVPDEEGMNNLAGELSHPSKKPSIPVHYTGLLSRCSKTGIPERNNHLLVLLSGPEPQRSLLEKKVLAGLSDYPGTVTMIRGLPGNESQIPSGERITVHNHLPADALCREMQEASYIVCRSGYSSIMDAMALGKRCILIPTPGQTEQEYLGKSLMEKNIALSIPQKNFSLFRALDEASAFNYSLPVFPTGSGLREAIGSVLHQVAAPARG